MSENVVYRRNRQAKMIGGVSGRKQIFREKPEGISSTPPLGMRIFAARYNADSGKRSYLS
jgi:hypothetical protein